MSDSGRRESGSGNEGSGKSKKIIKIVGAIIGLTLLILLIVIIARNFGVGAGESKKGDEKKSSLSSKLNSKAADENLDTAFNSAGHKEN